MKYDKLIALLENGATAVNFDLHISDELYVRTRVERMSSRVKAFYFVRSGDMGEQSEGVCPFDGYDRFLTELPTYSAGNRKTPYRQRPSTA